MLLSVELWFIGFVVTLLVFSSPHPQCLDFQLPFEKPGPKGSPYCDLGDGPQSSGFSTDQCEGDLSCVCGLPVATGLRNPIAAVHAGDGSGRLFIVEQIGEIRILLANNTLLLDPFLNISCQVVTSEEQGLLGLAFHPDFEENGRFFVYYSTSVISSNKSRISEFYLQDHNPNLANTSSERIILTISKPHTNNNGGQLLFKDGYLLVFLGDGGGTGDRFGSIGNGQNRFISISIASSMEHI